MYLCSSYCLLCMFSVSDSSIYMIYFRSFNFPYVIYYYLYLHTWTTSLDHVHVYLLCTSFGFIIYTCRAASDNPGFSCLDPRDRTLVALLEQIRVRSGSFRDDRSAAEAWIIATALPPSFSPVWFLRPLLLLMSTSLFCISLHVLYLVFLVM